MTLEMTVSSHFAHTLAGVLAELGWSEAAAKTALKRYAGALKHDVRRGNGSQKSTRLSLASFEAMFAYAEAALNDPLIGLKAGHIFRIANYGQTGAIYAFAQDLRDVIQLNARYQKIAIDIGEISYAVQGEEHMAVIDPYVPLSERERYPHALAVVMAAYGTAYQWLSWGSGQAIQRVDLPFAAREGAEKWAHDQFRCPVTFGADQGRLVFSEKAVTQLIPTADAEKRAIAINRLEALLGGEVDQLRFVQAVRQAIRAGLAQGAMNASTLAERLGLSDGQLRKQMKAAGLSYQSELDHVRRTILHERFSDGASFASISNDLGYNDQAAFNRAMRRWYGVAPSEWKPNPD